MLASALDDTPAGEQPRRLSDFVGELVADLPARREKGKPGLSSGFPTVDSRTGGLRPGSLVVIAAGTGVGKSLVATNIALAARVPAILFSLEMTGIEVAERMIAAASGVAATRIQRGAVTDGEILVLKRQAEAHSHLWIDERPAPTVAEIAATARALRRRENVGLVVVDYLQIVRTEQDERREAEVAAVARGLRALARRLSVPVIALAQLNRDGQVRDSAVIEHEAHVVAVFERKKGSEQATLELRKNRHGPEDCVALRFDRETLRLREEDRRS
jgi:replicative DNA helicase